jgi:hypothetical protein
MEMIRNMCAYNLIGNWGERCYLEVVSLEGNDNIKMDGKIINRI